MKDRSSEPSESRTWVEDEAQVGSAVWGAVRRLGRRSVASWPVWVVAALAITGVGTLMRARRPVAYTVTVVLRVTEGAVRTGAAKLSVSALRASVNELAFTRGRLQDLMRRRPGAFPHPQADPTLALEDTRSRINVSITENDFVEDRAETDPPRSARIAVGYTGSTPEIAWTISHDLAEMIIGTALAGQRQAISRLETVTGSALGEAEARLAEVRPLSPDDARARRATQRFQAVETAATAAQLSRRGSEENQTLRFEMVDPGRMPRIPSKAGRAIDAVVMLTVVLFAAGLFAGAFDPRVLDSEDVATLGLASLGTVPALPGMGGRPTGGGTTGGGVGRNEPETRDMASPRV